MGSRRAGMLAEQSERQMISLIALCRECRPADRRQCNPWVPEGPTSRKQREQRELNLAIFAKVMQMSHRKKADCCAADDGNRWEPAAKWGPKMGVNTSSSVKVVLFKVMRESR